MHKAILKTLLGLASSTAMAAWTEIGANDLSYTYVDPATISRTGDRVKMWHLLDFNAVQSKVTGTRYMSERLQYEYDCKEKRARMLNALAQSRNMGRGAVVEDNWNSQQWEPVPPGGLINYLWKYACGKR